MMIQEKLQKYKQPGYFAELKDKVDQLKRQIEDTHKNNKSKKTEAFLNAKNLHQLENGVGGEKMIPETVLKGQQIENEIINLGKKTEKQRERINDIKEEMKEIEASIEAKA